MVARSTRRRILAFAALAFVVAACNSDVVGGPGTTTAPNAVSSSTTTSTTIRTPTTSTTSTSTSTAIPTTTTDPAPGTTAADPVTESTVTSTATRPPTRDGSIYDLRPPSDLPAPPLPEGWVTQQLGTSVQGRDITALVRQTESSNRGVLVVGGIHGNEPASPPTVRSFVGATFGDDVTVWLVPELNPDGVAAGTRWNANGVDLNRNFSWDWRPSDGGAGPLSEPESKAIADFIAAARPAVVVWVHQPYGYVSSVGGTDRAFESAWSVGSGLATRSGVTQHGGGESWTFFEAELPSMLIEIDSWDATESIVAAQRAGFQALLAELGWDR